MFWICCTYLHGWLQFVSYLCIIIYLFLEYHKISALKQQNAQKELLYCQKYLDTLKVSTTNHSSITYINVCLYLNTWFINPNTSKYIKINDVPNAIINNIGSYLELDVWFFIQSEWFVCLMMKLQPSKQII